MNVLEARGQRWLSIAWGMLLAFLLTRHFFLLPEGMYFKDHEHESFLQRLMEFRDCLKEGYLFPQWCVHFRQGRGSPFFSFYQPGVFYAASLMPSWLSEQRQFGCALCLFALAGYSGMVRLVGRPFGSLAGSLAGALLLASVYVSANLYIRVDLAEFAAMMLIPFFLSFLVDASRGATHGQLAWLSLTSAGIVVTHPVMGLFSYGFAVLFVIATAIVRRDWNNLLFGGMALFAGVCLSSFYWMPVLFERAYVQDPHFRGVYDFRRNFVEPMQILGSGVTRTPIPVKLGLPMMIAVAAGVVSVVRNWKRWDETQRHVCLLGLGGMVLSFFFISSASRMIWEQSFLMQQSQFPWRLLATLSISASVVGGIAAGGGRSKSSAIGTGLALLLLAAVVVLYSRVLPVAKQIPATATEIADRYFAPDIEDEWLPRDAAKGMLNKDQLRRVTGLGDEDLRFELSAGKIEFDVSLDRPAQAEVMHYYFPVGWSATINGKPLKIEPDRLGLMKISFPEPVSGRVTLQFGMTPWRKRGVILSVATLAIGGMGLLMANRRRQRVSLVVPR